MKKFLYIGIACALLVVVVGYGVLASRRGNADEPRPVGGITVDPKAMLSLAQLRDWQIDLDRRGLRATGSPAHEAYIDELANRLRAAGVPNVGFETVRFRNWTAGRWGLSVVGSSGVRALKAGAYIPYSGSTPAGGVTGQLVDIGHDMPSGQDVAGKIVLFDPKVSGLPNAGARLKATYRYDPQDRIAWWGTYRRPFMAQGQIIELEERLAKLGAAGMIVVTDAPQSYSPYDRVIRTVPGVFVGGTTGEGLKRLARDGARIRLELTASSKDVESRNVIAMIPGVSDEIVAIHSHTDGTNGLEDNGPNAIVDIARYLARQPRGKLPRTAMVLLTTGHFAGGVGIESFLADHRQDGLLKRMAAVVTIEHLGAMAWSHDGDGRLEPLHEKELSVLFAPRIPALLSAGKRMLIDADAGPGLVMTAFNPDASGAAHEAAWPGEGQYFWSLGRIPTINYITGPEYLLDWGPGFATSEKVDYGLLHRETVAFAQMVLDLSRVPFSDLRPK